MAVYQLPGYAVKGTGQRQGSLAGVTWSDTTSAGSELTKTITETASLLEELAIAVGISLADSGSGVEVFPIAASGSVTESGNINDLVEQILATLGVTDSGTVSDSVSLLTELLKSIQDSGNFVDEVTQLLAELTVSEAGTITELISKLAEGILSINDTGSFVENISSISVEALINDIIVSLDDLIVENLITIQDSGITSESIALLLATIISVTEQANAVEEITSLQVTLNLSDNASGQDIAGLSQFLTILDNLHASDVVVVTTTALAITTIQFVLTQRKAEFILALRDTIFTLKPRGILK